MNSSRKIIRKIDEWLCGDLLDRFETDPRKAQEVYEDRVERVSTYKTMKIRTLNHVGCPIPNMRVFVCGGSDGTGTPIVNDVTNRDGELEFTHTLPTGSEVFIRIRGSETDHILGDIHFSNEDVIIVEDYDTTLTMVFKTETSYRSKFI